MNDAWEIPDPSNKLTDHISAMTKLKRIGRTWHFKNSTLMWLNRLIIIVFRIHYLHKYTSWFTDEPPKKLIRPEEKFLNAGDKNTSTDPRHHSTSTDRRWHFSRRISCELHQLFNMLESRFINELAQGVKRQILWENFMKITKHSFNKSM